jgi:hypothetical protein
MVRRIDDLVLGMPGNRKCLWPSTTKQGSGVGYTLNASFMSLALIPSCHGGVFVVKVICYDVSMVFFKELNIFVAFMAISS